MQAINFSTLIAQAKESGDIQTTVPEGDYVGQITEAEAKIAGTGNPMIKVKIRIMGGPHDGQVVWNNFVLAQSSPKSVSIFIRDMATLGITSEALASVQSLDPLAPALVGRQFAMKVAHRDYQGTTYCDVKNLKPLTAPTGAPSAPPPLAPAPAAPVAPAATQAPLPVAPALPPTVLPAAPAAPAPAALPVAPLPAATGALTPPAPPF